MSLLRDAISSSLLLVAFTIFMAGGFIYTYGIAGVSFICAIWLSYTTWVIFRSNRNTTH